MFILVIRFNCNLCQKSYKAQSWRNSFIKKHCKKYKVNGCFYAHFVDIYYNVFIMRTACFCSFLDVSYFQTNWYLKICFLVEYLESGNYHNFTKVHLQNLDITKYNSLLFPNNREHRRVNFAVLLSLAW